MTDKTQEALDAVQEHGSQRKAAKALGIARSTLQARLSRNEGLERASVEMGFDLRDVKSAWLKNDEFSVQLYPKQNADPNQYVDGLRKAINDHKPPKLSNLKKPKGPQVGLTLYPIPDVHHGMLAWGEETGTPWDINLSIKTYVEAYTELFERSDPTEDATLLNLGDFFHANDSSNSTFKSKHLLDVDSRHEKMLWSGVAMFKSIIDLALQKHERVKVVNIKGNHDPDACVVLAIAMSYAYQNEQRVNVVKNASEFWFDQYGKTMIGANHGVQKKDADLALKMAVERPEMWGQTRFRHFLKGHLHHTIAKEVGGVIIETFQTLTPKDAHAANGGYLSGRSISSIRFDPEFGEVSRNIVRLT